MAFVWTERSLQWFARAAQETQYYRRLVNKISSWLDSGTVVYDLGCGAGFLSMEIAGKVQQVIAVDISAEVISFLQEKLREEKIGNVAPITADWHTWRPAQPADVVVLSYCNGIRDKLSILSALTSRYLISVLPYSRREDSFNVQKLVSGDELVYGRETVSEATRFLQEKGIPFQFFDCSDEFGQPLATWEEARDFLRFYFDIGSGTLLEEFLEENLVQRSSDYYLPGKKRSGVLVINKQDL